MEEIEERLHRAAETGEPEKLRATDEIKAEWIRNILLSLPRGGQPGAPPVGLCIEGEVDDDGRVLGPVIKGPLNLSDASIPGTGAIAPLSLTHCIIEGGFSGARSRFSSLRLRNCRFRDSKDQAASRKDASVEDGRDSPAENESQAIQEGNDSPKVPPKVPTIDLGSARIDSGLYMFGLSPDSTADHLWIRAAGLRVAGAIDLSCTHLRAPPEQKAERLNCEPSVTCIDLANATIGADIYALNGFRCEGRFYARGLHVRGNIWLGGAIIEVPGANALTLQRAVIDGSLMLNDPPDRADGSGAVSAFICAGNLCLRAARVGGDVDFRSAFVAGEAELLDIEIRRDLTFDAAIRDKINLNGCEIGGSANISRLVVGRSFPLLSMTEGKIGQALARLPAASTPRLVGARHAALNSIPGAFLVETLWEDADGADLFQLGFIQIGKDFHLLDGFCSGLNRALKEGYSIATEDQALELLRIHGVYAHGEPGFPILGSSSAARELTTKEGSEADREVERLPADFFRVAVKARGPAKVVTACVLHGDRIGQYEFTIAEASSSLTITKRHLVDGPVIDHVPRIKGPFLRAPKGEDFAKAVRRRDWPMLPALRRMADSPESGLPSLHEKLVEQAATAAELRGEVDLGGLNCETLEDGGGDGWGRRVHLNLNHFVYRRADWRSGHSRTPGGAQKPGESRWRRWFTRSHSVSGKTRSDESRANWEGRRNWLFQQYYLTPDQEPHPYEDAPDLPTKPFRAIRKIKDTYYRPQPFEQVIRVARAEGREGVAANFEILKRRIDWRHFNRSARWWLGYIGIIVASAWLYFRGPESFPKPWILVAGVCTWAVMLQGTALRGAFKRGLEKIRPEPRHRAFNRWASKLTVWALYILPAVLLAIFHKPFHLLVALMIFLAIRLLTTIANGLFYIGFGYLRRPVAAIATLIVAFVFGWYGVIQAERYGMLVVNAEPVATVAADAIPLPPAAQPGPGPANALSRLSNQPAQRRGLTLGNPRVPHDEAGFSHEIPCGPLMSRALYALDVLIPIVDLGEERRCEIRRRPESDRNPRLERVPDEGAWGEMELGELVQNIPEITVHNRRFWWLLKALYAIAGWLIVSLSILTFAQAMRAHAEPPTEHK